MEAQRVRAPKLGKSLLQKALRPEPDDRVYDWHCLPPEYPAGHRKANCRIAQMHHSHKPPPGSASGSLRGEHLTYRHNSNGGEVGQGTSVPSSWHRSNSGIEGVTARGLKPLANDSVNAPLRRHSSTGRNPVLGGLFRPPRGERKSVSWNRLLGAAPSWRHNHGRKTALGGKLLEVGQIVALQRLPAAEQLSILGFQLLELALFGLGWG